MHQDTTPLAEENLAFRRENARLRAFLQRCGVRPPDAGAEPDEVDDRTAFTRDDIINGLNSLIWLSVVREKDGEWHWETRLANPEAAQRIFQVSLPPGRTFDQVWHASKLPEDVERMAATSRNAMRSGRPGYSQEYRIRLGDGSIRWLAEDVRIRRIGEGVWSLFGVCTDVTERRAAEDAVRHVTGHARCLLWYADVTEREDAPGRYRWETRVADEEGAQRFLPLAPRPGETYAQAWFRSRRPEDARRLNEVSGEALRTGASGYTQEIQCVDAGGAVRWLHEQAHIERVSPGRFRLSGVCTDITEHKEDDALRDALFRLAALLAQALPLKTVGVALARECRRVFGHDALAVLLHDEAGGCAERVYLEDTFAGETEPREVEAGPRSPLTDSLRRTLSGEALLIVREEEPASEDLARFGDTSRLSRTLMFVPIRWEGRPLGTLSVQSYTPGRYSQRHLEALQAFADLAGPAFQRARAEDALRQSEERYRLLYQQSPVPYQSLDGNGCILDVNDTWLAELGYQRAEVVGKWFGDFLAEDGPALFRQRFPRFKEAGSTHGVEVTMRRKDGQMLIASFDGLIARDSSGAFLRTHCVFHNITERKRVERLLQERTQLNQTLLDAFPCVALLMRCGTREIVASNAAAARAGAVPGAHCFDTWGRRAEPCPWCQAPVVWQSGEPRRRVVEGEGVVWDAHWIPVSPDIYMHFAFDITEQRRAEEHGVRLEAQLRQQQKLESIGTLASGVAHEINNPINGAMNYAQLILDGVEPDSRTAEYASEILIETQRVATIVRNLLQFSRQDRQAHSPADIADIVERTLSLIRTVIRRDQITIEVDVPEDLPSVKCRSQQIQQVLMNLLTNARDALNARYAGHDPRKIILVRCAVFEREGRRWVRTTVEDRGHGIPPGAQERVFDPFFTTKPRDVGTGLGLAISHGIVREHHGELHFETEPGEWTRFHLDLPVDNGWELGAASGSDDE